jgi:hypothetical protein
MANTTTPLSTAPLDPIDRAFGIDGRPWIVASCERQATHGDLRRKIG